MYLYPKLIIIKIKIGDETLSFEKSRKQQVLQQFKRAKNGNSAYVDKEFDLSDSVSNYGNEPVIIINLNLTGKLTKW